MDREILFRAKHIHAMDSNDHLNGRWVKGYLSDKNYIYDEHLEGEFLVDENTICQYTGLIDKNGEKIWENDIVKVKYSDNFAEITQVVYTKHGYSPYSNEYECEGCCCSCEVSEVEVVGNIFDNPELLEGKTDV